MAVITIPGMFLTGDHASRPAANTVGGGTLYSCTTDDLVYQSDGSSWSTWATLGGTGLTTPVAESIVRTANASAGSDYTTTSSSFVDVDATNLTIQLTTEARRCMVGVVAMGDNSNASGRVDLAVEIDGAIPNGAFITISQHSETGNIMNLSFTYLTDVLSAASHDFVLQFARGSAGTASLRASTAAPLQFWVAETLLTA